MKRSLFFILCLSLTLGAVSQTQTGYVKTPGRMVNGKRVPGEGLKGATVQVRGRTSILVKNADGSFSFPVSAKQFVIQSVKKNGYQLVDADAAPKTYILSSAPVYLVMETPSQQMEKKLKAERKLRTTLSNKLQQREAEIEELKEQNRITREQYLAAMQQIYDLHDSNVQLIGDMADYYSRIDYDQLDDFNTQVSELILEGRLTLVDSLLRSKGDINERIRQLNKHHEANVQTREQLEKSEAVEQFDREDLARDCYSFFRRFVLDNQLDSAACYIEMRAALDTGNCQWQADAGSFLMRRGLSTRAGEYFDRALKTARDLASDTPEQYEPLLARTMTNVALLYAEAGDVAAARLLFDQALDLFKRLSQSAPSTYRPLVASALNNLGLLYAASSVDMDKAEPLFKEALDIYATDSADNADIYAPAVASIWNNLALLYEAKGRDNDSEQMYLQALQAYQRLCASSDSYIPEYAATLNNLSALYFKNPSLLDKGFEMLNRALEAYRQLASEDSGQFAPALAVALNNLSVLDFSLNRTEEGEAAFTEALDIYRGLVNDSPGRYLPMLAKGTYEQAIRYYRGNALDMSETLFNESLAAYRTLASRDEDAYLPDVAKVLRNLANVYDKQLNWAKAERLYQEELGINRTLAVKSPDEYNSHLARNYGNLSNHAILVKNFAQAVEYARAGLAIDNSRLFIQANLAAALLFMGETSEAEKIYQKYKLELRDTFLDDFDQFESLGIIPAEAQESVKNIKQMIN